MKMNIAWHTTHPMPRRATMTQRIAWHREHEKHCGCMPTPQSVQSEMARRSTRKPAAKNAESQPRL